MTIGAQSPSTNAPIMIRYAPSPEHYWMHGHSSETDFTYVTTNSHPRQLRPEIR